MQITPLGDNALVLELGTVIDESTHRRVQSAWQALAAAQAEAESVRRVRAAPSAS